MSTDTKTTEYDVVVLGGGPAGMMTAGRAASRGLRVLLIEKNAVLGKKLSITGGGRCNITNAEFDIRTFLKHYGKAEQFLYAPFAQFGVQETFNFFTDRALPLIIEEKKRVFPETQKATDVVRVMEHYVRSSGCVVQTGTAVRGFEMNGDSIVGVHTSAGVVSARAYVVASGGASYQETGSTGEGFTWLKTLGHTVHASNPNLVPLIVSEPWVKRLSGTVLPQVCINFKNEVTKIKKQGDVLITHFGLSGPVVLNSAYEVKEMLEDGIVQVSIDLFPKDDIGSLRAKFQKLIEDNPRKTLLNLLKSWFTKGVVEAILQPLPTDGRLTLSAMLTREVRYMLVDRMKNITLTVTGTKGLDWSVVSDGGVDLKDIDTRTMKSKIHPNLYVVGDVLHVNRPSGGYSLQLCWTTGFVAGNSVCT